MNTHETTPTKFIQANGINFAYRIFGKKSGTPLVCLQHFNGTMDQWDSAVINRLAQERLVILFNNAGIAQSGGSTPNSIAGMTLHTAAFIEALALGDVDLLGFSIGGMIAQDLLLSRPKLIRRAILLATGPQGGEGMGFTDLSASEQHDPIAFFLKAFFTTSTISQAAGKDYLKRVAERKNYLDPPIGEQSVVAQLDAIREWGKPPVTDRYADLKSIKHPVLVVTGITDTVVPPINSFILEQHLSNAQLIIYPDSSHGAYSQYSDLFVRHVSLFLDRIT